jgi:hypothetical protein
MHMHFYRPQFSGTRAKAVVLVLVALTIGAVIGSTRNGSAATTVAPTSTSPTTISGTASLGSTLTASHGTFSGSTPINYSYQWRRCDTNGGSCADIDKATKTTYTLAQIDVGNAMRAVVTAKNKDGSDSSTSVPTAVVTAPAPAPATGCPGGSGGIAVAGLGLPARLNIDGQAISPAVVLRSSAKITVRLHVTACGSRSVQGAMVYATAVPFNQYTIPAEAATGADGWASLTMSQQVGYPASRQQQLLTMFVRASKTGDPELGGISTRRLISFPVNLRGSTTSLRVRRTAHRQGYACAT